MKIGANYEYQYALTDHQGNTRVLFTSVTPTEQSVTSTFETAAQATEATQFQNYPSGAGINPVATNNHTASGTKSQYLNGGYAGKVGVAKNYTVFPGDVVKIEAYGKYSNLSTTTSGLNTFATALLSAFSLAPPGNGEVGTPSAAVNTWGGIEAGGYGDGTLNSTEPKAFVNIIIFDKDYNLLDWTYYQMPAAGATAPAYMSASYTIKERGYAYMYVSNENPTLVDVYFDDVKMSYTPSNIVQSNEYYPYGLQTVNSWTRANTTGNNFLANAGTELNTTSQLYDLEFRNYDPILGRLHQVDPMADKYASLSPYHYSFNNPATFTDANGADVMWGLYTREEAYRANMGRDQAWSHGGATGDLSPEAMAESVHTPSGGKWYKVTTFWKEESGYKDANGNFIQDHTYDYSYGYDTEMVYVEDDEQTQGRGLNFSDLWDNYGSGLSHTDPKTGKELFPNYCAINLSEALIKSGLRPDGTKCYGTCSSNTKHIIRAQELSDWLQDNLTGVKVITGENFMDQISGKTGIVFFQNYYEGEEGSLTGDHIDLWNKNEMGSYGVIRTWIRTNAPGLGQMMGMSDLSKSTQILFWEIK